LSAVVADDAVLGVLNPGEHGSTFGGNPLACAVGREVLPLLEDGRLAENAAQLGRSAADRLRAGSFGAVTAIRQIGLWIALDIKPSAASGREVCELLADRGVLCKDTHDHTIRIAPPLVTSAEDLDWALDRIESVLTGLGV
ncbi:MAG: aminotransferase class III-fold pyridoxal phosphate-dependent enzyme, partial [Thermoleophilaceae bacterium]